MTTRLTLLLRPAEGALLRLLGTVQRRGFELAAIRTEAQPEAGLWRVELDLAQGSRDIANLRRQIEKLYDVDSLIDEPLVESIDPELDHETGPPHEHRDCRALRTRHPAGGHSTSPRSMRRQAHAGVIPSQPGPSPMSPRISR